MAPRVFRAQYPLHVPSYTFEQRDRDGELPGGSVGVSEFDSAAESV